ncbi:pseudaminic acid cytidylyltransferase [Castellaniella sp.]|uniref:pseudaminic acid cytidylyltransferase n=1 Tax=Castellaniella sp. TaxID=1955812 RepID=UPI002AFE0686|nr:pseudaminic acid cytidylyltransferase [Castellaniella sp.]
MNVAIIPARGGSKRIPYKNIRDFCGKPMIAWSIDSAIRSGLFDHVVVSTEDLKIAEIARNYGADVPFMRPAELSDDFTTTRPIINHAIKQIESIYKKPDYVCCLYATAPFATAQDLKDGFDMLVASDCEFVFTIAAFQAPVQRALKICQNGRVAMFNPEFRTTRSQDLEAAYHDAGQFYWGKTDAFLDNLSAFSNHSVPLVLPSYRVQDIDTQEDWIRAEKMFKIMDR